MPNFELLNSLKHSRLRILQMNRGEPHFAKIVVSEFVSAAISSPIMFSKNAVDGRFFAGAVLSLKPGEPSLKTAAERGDFTPLSLRCNGFYISGGQIAIDRDNPRFSETEGDPLFTDSQQPAESLQRIQFALGEFQAGLEATNVFIKSLLELKLIEAIDMSLSFDDGERLLLRELYTINRSALRDLDDATAIRLFRSGQLELAYVVAASLKQFDVLAHLRNQRLLNMN
ncbi:MAG: SapC family protein [Steroidobacter sp.]